ncbi:MAG: MBL fold metallo-hydrolase [SAR324 cluster bacterium]|uniref:MBL fold metallo-hydrolase n=1 Tax=SAR324 cluster bacterium TaxID=2024889 RepID=A0A7X9FSD8_9DELT|nr:MBL fold metallo-hydrolase [SAR324 cluster bacterium]
MRNLRWLIFCFLLLLSSPYKASSETKPLTLDFIYVGDGDSILIQTPEFHSILIDTGNLLSGFDVVEHLKLQGIRKLDALILTHPHLDHIGGVFAAMRLFKVTKVFDNGEAQDGDGVYKDISRWYRQLVRADPNYEELYQAKELRFGDLKIRVLWPPKQRVYSDWNTNSLVLQLQYGAFKALLMGDANKATEKALIESKLILDETLSLLKAGHHGAKDTASVKFLKKSKAKIVLISSAIDSPKDYPDSRTLKRYQEHGATLFRTDEGGTIRFEAYPSGSLHVIQNGKIEVF